MSVVGVLRFSVNTLIFLFRCAAYRQMAPQNSPPEAAQTGGSICRYARETAKICLSFTENRSIPTAATHFITPQHPDGSHSVYYVAVALRHRSLVRAVWSDGYVPVLWGMGRVHRSAGTLGKRRHLAKGARRAPEVSVRCAFHEAGAGPGDLCTGLCKTRRQRRLRHKNGDAWRYL